MRLANYTRDVATGAALTTGSTAITGPDGGAVATVALDGATGRWSYEGNGSPGITQSSYTGAGQTRKIKGDAFGQEGWVYPAEIPEMMRIHGDGVYGSNPMPLTAPGGMTVQVGIGNMFILGVLLPIYTAQSLAVAAAHATLGRKDIIVGRLTR
ncbi:MAG TPA: hypothetical protein VK689_16220, partial [Armatimonadota bacterium]|nr:hypothetical protein [Armatimonadota bacterium]